MPTAPIKKSLSVKLFRRIRCYAIPISFRFC